MFLCALTLLHRIHTHHWPAIARFGFVISVVGLGLWIVGGTMNGLGVRGVEPQSAGGRFIFEVLRTPQAGWGLFGVGLIPIGVAGIANQRLRATRFLLPAGSLILLELPIKSVLGERPGGLAILTAFGLGWLAVATLLFVESKRRAPTSLS
jgi:hypothetical protein